MESKPLHRPVHLCGCPDCQQGLRNEIVEEHRAINQLISTLDEKWRRVFAGFWATVYGRGGIERLTIITGMSRTTIRRGKREFQRPECLDTSRIREPGGGRKRIEKKHPDIVEALEQLLRDATAGDPMTDLKWTHKSTRKLCAVLRRRGLRVGRETVARLLRQRDYSLRTNRKRLAGTHHPDRDRQFRYLTRIRRWYLTHGLPVISVDTKKKELVGNFKNPGRCWRKTDRDVLDHDFAKDASGRGIPYGSTTWVATPVSWSSARRTRPPLSPSPPSAAGGSPWAERPTPRFAACSSRRIVAGPMAIGDSLEGGPARLRR